MTKKPLPKALQTIVDKAAAEVADEMQILAPIAQWAETASVDTEQDLETAAALGLSRGRVQAIVQQARLRNGCTTTAQLIDRVAKEGNDGA